MTEDAKPTFSDDLRAQLERFMNDPELCMPSEREQLKAMLKTIDDTDIETIDGSRWAKEIIDASDDKQVSAIMDAIGSVEASFASAAAALCSTLGQMAAKDPNVTEVVIAAMVSLIVSCANFTLKQSSMH